MGRRVVCMAAVLCALSGAAQAIVIGDWEGSPDGWELRPEAVTNGASLDYSETGATLNDQALKISIPAAVQPDAGNQWWRPLLGLNVMDKPDIRDAIRDSRTITIDVTRLVSEWQGEPQDGFSDFRIIFNTGGDGWADFIQSPDSGFGRWSWRDGDRVAQHIEWDYTDVIPRIQFDNLWWFEIWIVARFDEAYEGECVYYFDSFDIPSQTTASDPNPRNGATDIQWDTLLNWRGAMVANAHDIYFGTDATAIAEVTQENLDSYPEVVYARTEEALFDPGLLEMGATYWWRVDEVDANEVTMEEVVYPGDVWNFTVAEYVALDDFEDYADYAELTAVWPDANELIQDMAQSGGQSMKGLFGAEVAEVTRAMPAELTDLQGMGLRSVELYFYGDPNNPAETLYAVVEDGQGNADTVAYDGDPADVTQEEWQFWRVALSALEGVDLSDVSRIGFGFADAQGAAVGEIYFDEIRLYPGRCVLDQRTPEFARVDFLPLGMPGGDCVVGPAELMVLASDWLMADGFLPATTTDPNEGAGGLLAHYRLDEGEGTAAADATGNHDPGELMNGASWVTPGYDGTGHAVAFDGNVGGAKVAIGTWDPNEGETGFSASLWARWTGDQTNDHQGLLGKRDSWSGTNAMQWFLETTPNGELALRQYAGGVFSAQGVLNPFVGKWAHVAVTFDGTTGTIYLNGEVVASGPFTLADKPTAEMGIGCTHGGTNTNGEVFDGAIDNVQIYGRALSAEEVAYLADPTPGDGEVYVPIGSQAELYSEEGEGDRAIDMYDFSVLSEYWLTEQMWP